jgi:hypothetical protein
MHGSQYLILRYLRAHGGVSRVSSREHREGAKSLLVFGSSARVFSEFRSDPFFLRVQITMRLIIVDNPDAVATWVSTYGTVPLLSPGRFLEPRSLSPPPCSCTENQGVCAHA